MNILYITFSSKDWLFFFNEQLKRFPPFPFLWDSTKGYGLGENIAHTLWIRTYHFITSWVFHHVFHLNWLGIEVLIFFVPVIILSIFSSYYLTRSWIGSLIYTTNTYILMIVGGGQMGVALAYSIAPLIFGWLSRERNLITGGLLLGLQIMWDPRIALITIIAVLGYYLLIFRLANLRFLITSFLIGIFLNFFWILPLMKTGATNLQNLGEAFTATGMVEFLSFASFSNTISLLHPNWPENIFGKTYFMRPEFLVIPIIAFLTLLLCRRDKKVLFFTFLALFGAFLAKGSRPPFGGVYLWLFNNFPGMNMFRDPTKFYVLVALSYSVLIPYSMARIAQWFKKLIDNR